MLCFYAVYQLVLSVCVACGRVSACVYAAAGVCGAARGVGVGVPVSVRGAADGGARSVGGASSLLSATGLPRSRRVEP